jgi:4'-phosphopantetheinyl transferase EntD
MSATFTVPFPELSLISQHFTDHLNEDESLSPSELLIIAQSVPKRRAAFSTGRNCARRALVRFIDDPPELLQGKGGEPIWPEGIVGSISHSEKLAGAVVASKNEITAIGIDIETIGGVKQAMYPLILLDTEIEMINGKHNDTALWTTLLFSLKESFYKLQYPLTGLWLDFKDISISENNGKFSFIQVKSSHDLSAISFDQIKVDWTVVSDQVITLCYFSA